MSKPSMKTAIFLDATLPIGVAGNTGIHLATQYGAMRPDVAGPPVRDAAGEEHSGIPVWPNVVLAVSAKDLGVIIAQARELAAIHSDVLVLDYPEAGFTTSTDDEYRTAMQSAMPNSITYFGCLIHGPRKQVDRATKGVGTQLWGNHGQGACINDTQKGGVGPTNPELY